MLDIAAEYEKLAERASSLADSGLPNDEARPILLIDPTQAIPAINPQVSARRRG